METTVVVMASGTVDVWWEVQRNRGRGSGMVVVVVLVKQRESERDGRFRRRGHFGPFVSKNLSQHPLILVNSGHIN
jgi:hypothetical protein